MSNGNEKIAAQIRDQAGRCWGCDYLLRGVESGRCPECGRGFDRTTMNFGRPVGDLARGLIRPMSIWMVVMLWVGAALIVWGTRWPGDWNFWRVDRMVFSHLGNLKEQWNAGGIRWRAFAIGLVMTIAMGGAAMVRELIRRVLIRWHRPPEDLRGNSGRRLLFLVVGLMLATIWVGAGSARRWGTVWAGRQKAQPVDLYGSIPTAEPPVPLMAGEEAIVVRRLLKGGDESERRIALKLLIERNVEAALPVLREAVVDEKDEQIASAELHLIGLYRDVSTEQLLEKFLHDDRAGVRAAAIDAKGMLHNPSYEFPEAPRLLMRSSASVADPAIRLSAFTDYGRQAIWRRYLERDVVTANKPLSLTPTDRAAFTSVMVSGQALAEREAAARALLPWPSVSLRVAEWGVWLNEDGDLKMMQKVTDEIPPFVHRSGNPVSEFAGRKPQFILISKPLIHLSAHEAMSVDIDVRIRGGRPWYVYPMPDDYEVSVATIPRAPKTTTGSQQVDRLGAFDAPELGRLDDMGSGYPWMTPRHRRARMGNTQTGSFREITEVGAHWQSLIVTPEKLSWMKEPDVGDDKRFAWWKRLRKVNCSWVSNRGESERFLYYDGPTNLKAPYRFFYDGQNLEAQLNKTDELTSELQGGQTAPPWPRAVFVDNDLRKGLFIRVQGNEVSGQELSDPLGKGKTLHGDEVEATLKELITGPLRRLTDSEAAGLLDCWRDEFFKKPGQRMLLLLSPEDYERFCPMVVRPKPATLVRVGIVVTEFK